MNSTWTCPSCRMVMPQGGGAHSCGGSGGFTDGYTAAQYHADLKGFGVLEDPAWRATCKRAGCTTCEV